MANTVQSSEDVLEHAAAWLSAGKRVALATVVSTWGSAPRPAGSQLAVREDSAFVGSVSGGCIESAVVQEALAVMDGGEPRVLEFGVSNESAWQVGLACGGKIRVYVEPVASGAKRALVEELVAARRQKRSAVLCTALATGAQRLVYPFEAGEMALGAELAAEAVDAADVQNAVLNALRAEIRSAATLDQSVTVTTDRGEVLLRPFNPPLRLVVIGAVHIAQALCPMAALAGFEAIVVDPRTAFATAERFPGVTLHTEWPDEALGKLGLDHRSAVVTLTHDPKLDEPALTAALDSQAFYIGALGSKKTQASRLSRLSKQGYSEATLARIRGPVGLDIGARSAAEIAVSILAQIIQNLRTRHS